MSFTRITNDSLIVLGQFTSLQSLNLSACPNISSLEGIQRLSQLKWLSLRACRALRTADFTPIQHLPLVYADLSTTMISDSALACFKGMTTLAYLNIALTFITNISCLEGIPLTYLNISRTSVADISCVEDMPLTGFNAESSNVSILKPLEKTPLRYLNIVLCIGITDFSFIKKLKQLTQLKVSETSITDKDLANWCLPALKKLDLEGCRKISQKGLELLRESDLPSLTQLDLSGCNKIPKEEVREIFAGTRIKVTQKFIPLREE